MIYLVEFKYLKNKKREMCINILYKFYFLYKLFNLII